MLQLIQLVGHAPEVVVHPLPFLSAVLNDLLAFALNIGNLIEQYLTLLLKRIVYRSRRVLMRDSLLE